jgi:hypothetical protein
MPVRAVGQYVKVTTVLHKYKTLHERGPMTVTDLAAAAGVNQRYLREWLSHQAASNYLSYDPATQSFGLPLEQAMVFAIEDSPVSTSQFTLVHSEGKGMPISAYSKKFLTINNGCD